MFMVICLVEVSFFDMILQKCPLDRIHYIFIKLSLYWVICAMLGVQRNMPCVGTQLVQYIVEHCR